MTRLLPDVFYATKYEPWLRERYGDAWDNPTDKEKSAKKEAQVQFKRDRMQHGSSVTGILQIALHIKSLKRRVM